MQELAANDFRALPTHDFRQLTLMLLADTCTHVEAREHADALLHHLAPYAAENVVVGPSLDCYGSAARGVGELETLLGRFDDAGQHLRAALAFNEGMRSVRWVAHSQVALARLLKRRNHAGDHRQAMSLLDSARRTADERGLVYVTRMADELSS